MLGYVAWIWQVGVTGRFLADLCLFLDSGRLFGPAIKMPLSHIRVPRLNIHLFLLVQLHASSNPQVIMFPVPTWEIGIEFLAKGCYVCLGSKSVDGCFGSVSCFYLTASQMTKYPNMNLGSIYIRRWVIIWRKSHWELLVAFVEALFRSTQM